MKGNFLIGFVAGAVLAANASFAADSILAAPRPDPCAERPDYVPGVDANGQPVVRADVGAGPVPVPGQILAPLPNQRGASPGGRGRAAGRAAPATAVLDGQKLDPLVNPRPCQAPPAR